MTVNGDVLDANEVFYRLIRTGDYLAMEDLWARYRPISCSHPGGMMLIGREAVMQSWHQILAHDPPAIWPEEQQAVVRGSSAFVLTIERAEGAELMATNGFVLEGGFWRMINHQAIQMPAERAR